MGAILTAPFRKRARSELLYVVAALLLAVVGWLYVTATLLIGAALAVTAVGIPLIALAVTGARRLGRWHRALAGRLLDERIEPPAPRAPATGFYGRVQSGLTDVAGWRAVACLLLQLPLGALQGYVVAFTWVEGIVAVTYPIQYALGGNHVGFLEPVWARVLVVPVGVAMLLIAPWAVHTVVAPNRLLLRWLLGPSRTDGRVRELEHGRAVVLDDATATLRRIERDLHDGAQVRLVGLVMQLTMLRELTPQGPGRDLATAAHESARAAVTELRELARGIHPPVLDQGLAAALESLADRVGLPVEIATDLPDLPDLPEPAERAERAERPDPAIEAAAYFCAAELLTNAAKHAGATRATVTASVRGGRLRLVVRDDGAGGARVEPGGGLSGLLDRVRALDGDLRVDSPPGGPTVVTVHLPVRL